MARIVPADAQLRPRWSGRTDIGYRILDIDRKLFRVFTTERVQEVGTAHYAVIGGAEVPAEGGHIIWGTAEQDIAEAPIQPVQADTTPMILAGVTAMLNDLLTRIADLLPEPAPVIVDTTPFIASVEALRTEQAAQVSAESKRQARYVQEVRTWIRELSEGVQAQFAGMTVANRQFGEMSTATIRLLEANVSTERIELLTAIASKVDALRSDIEHLSASTVEAREATQRADAKRIQGLQLVDEFLAQIEGGHGLG